MAFASLCLHPAPQQQFEFFFSPDKLRQAAGVHGLEAAIDWRRSERCPCFHRTSNAFEVLHPKVLKLEQVAHKVASTFGNHDTVRLRNTLQARCKIWRLADDGLLLRCA